MLPSIQGESIGDLVDPVLQAMPELRELHPSLASPLSVEHLEVEVDSLTNLCEGRVSPMLCEQLEVHELAVEVVPVVDDVVSMIPLVEDVHAAGVLVPAPRSLMVESCLYPLDRRVKR